jgi:hypothetical protein
MNGPLEDPSTMFSYKTLQFEKVHAQNREDNEKISAIFSFVNQGNLLRGIDNKTVRR